MTELPSPLRGAPLPQPCAQRGEAWLPPLLMLLLLNQTLSISWAANRRLPLVLTALASRPRFSLEKDFTSKLGTPEKAGSRGMSAPFVTTVGPVGDICKRHRVTLLRGRTVNRPLLERIPGKDMTCSQMGFTSLSQPHHTAPRMPCTHHPRSISWEPSMGLGIKPYSQTRAAPCGQGRGRASAQGLSV